MRKILSILLLCLSIFFLTYQHVGAHLTGAFQDFIISMNDKKSSEELQETIKNTKEQHLALSKKTDEKKKEFTKEQEEMLKKMMFYDTVAFDTYASFILDNKEMVDAMANQKIMEKQVSEDLEVLKSLYSQYQSLKQALDSVKGYQDLLDEIKKNEMNKERLSKIFPNLNVTDKAQFASLLQAIWDTDMKKTDEHMIKDSSEISKNLIEWSKEGASNGIRNMPEKEINRHTTLKYLIQQDHVYVTYQHGDGHIILITQLKKHVKIKNAYYLQVEAGFLNGYPISSSLLKGLNGKFVIRCQSLITNENPSWMIQQGSNGFVLQPSATIMD